MISRRSILAGLPLLAAPARAQETKLPVVATFSILADLTGRIGGARLELTTLVGPGNDAHVYNPTPDDARQLAAAKLIIINGLGYEGWIERLTKASAAKAPTVVATKGVKPIREAGGHGHGHTHGYERNDPHAWQSVANVKIYVANIRDGLIAADPAGEAIFRANATAYLAELDALDKEIRDAIAAIPKERRRIITTHDSFAYFGATYGLNFIAPKGVSTESEPSAADVGKIIRQIRAEKIPAVFLENVTDPRLMERIAKESGAKIGGTLYSDALSAAGGPAASYVEMARSNLRALTAALAK